LRCFHRSFRRYLTLECSGLNTHNSLYSDFKDPDPLRRRRTCFFSVFFSSPRFLLFPTLKRQG